LINHPVDTVNLVIDSNTSDPIEGYSIFWKSSSESDHSLSIPLYIGKNEDRLREKYVTFITDLGEKRHNGKSLKSYFRVKGGYNVWWMSLLVEKNLVKSPDISDCLKLFALEEIIETLAPKRLRLITTDFRLFQTVKHLAQQLKIDSFEHIGTFDFSYRYKLKTMVPGLISGPLYILKNSIRHWSLRRLRKFKWHTGTEQLFIFSHFFNVHVKDGDNTEIYSKYWGILPELLKIKGISINFLNTFLISTEVPTMKSAVSWLTAINGSSDKNYQRHIYYYSFINFRLIFKVLLQFFIIYFRGLELGRMDKHFNPKQSHLNLWHILKNDWVDSMRGTVLSENLLLIALIDKAVSELQVQKLGLYLQENNGWERALVHAWERYQKSLIIGVPHTTIRYWDLRYCEDRRIFNCTNECLPRPDFVAVNGPIAKRMLIESGYLRDELVEVEALRYLQDEYDSAVVNSRSNENKHIIKVLVCGDIDQNSTTEMLKCVEKAVEIWASIQHDVKLEIVFKSHPVTKVNLEQFALTGLTETQSNLNDILTSFDIMIGADSTSASVEAYLKGLKVVVFVYQQRLNFSPLKGVKNVSFVYNYSDLLNVLTNHEEIFNSGDISQFFWTDKNLPKWNKIFKEAGYSNFN
jgi:surface carbohydrate biosynthesis protein (TIGR04326 family)